MLFPNQTPLTERVIAKSYVVHWTAAQATEPVRPEAAPEAAPIARRPPPNPLMPDPGGRPSGMRPPDQPPALPARSPLQRFRPLRDRRPIRPPAGDSAAQPRNPASKARTASARSGAGLPPGGVRTSRPGPDPGQIQREPRAHRLRTVSLHRRRRPRRPRPASSMVSAAISASGSAWRGGERPTAIRGPSPARSRSTRLSPSRSGRAAGKRKARRARDDPEERRGGSASAWPGWRSRTAPLEPPSRSGTRRARWRARWPPYWLEPERISFSTIASIGVGRAVRPADQGLDRGETRLASLGMERSQRLQPAPTWRSSPGRGYPP